MYVRNCEIGRGAAYYLASRTRGHGRGRDFCLGDNVMDTIFAVFGCDVSGEGELA
jgi:hypothetical protein